MFSIDEIKTKVGSDPRWATRAIVALFNKQTADEQSAEITQEKNFMGFNGVDAEILTSFAKQVVYKGRTLSQKQLAIAFKKLPKYSKQLLKIANKEI